MSDVLEAGAGDASSPPHFDVLIVGAGLSGIGSAYHLQQQCPDKRYAILEGAATFGGTWRIHTYPGSRSDSDMYTFGFRFKPWNNVPIAPRDDILEYLQEVITDNGIDEHIRYHHHITAAAWSSADKAWTLNVERRDSGESLVFTCDFLWMCQGYYQQAQGYTPDFKGMDRFKGPIVHPQTWPDDLDYTGKKVVVIGSGATAATVVPAMAGDAGHVTMLQRSPTFFAPQANEIEIADTLRRIGTPEEWVHAIVRLDVMHEEQAIRDQSFADPEALKKALLDAAREYLGPDYDIDTHFTPRYRPWRQRIAVLPDGDMFKAIRAGKASVVTDHIDGFTETGILLKSGAELEADIIVTATGFNLCVLGNIAFSIDGEPLDFAHTWTYRGIMYSGMPNMAWIFGYLRHSWTMRADMIGDFVCKLLKHMDAKGARMCTPTLRPEDRDMCAETFITEENFNAGYMMRSMHLMPKQGDREPWQMSQNYGLEKESIPNADLEDGTLVFE